MLQSVVVRPGLLAAPVCPATVPLGGTVGPALSSATRSASSKVSAVCVRRLPLAEYSPSRTINPGSPMTAHPLPTMDPP